MSSIYLDYNASTPVAPEVRAAMEPFAAAHFGNPSSGHWAAAPAKAALERARAQVAALVGARPCEIIFTSGGSEANNLALKGAWFSPEREPRRNRLIVSAVEHPAVMRPARFLQRLGANVSVLPVDRAGCVAERDLQRELGRGDAFLVSIMHANNEVGTIQPLPELGGQCRAARVPFHTDAAQSVGKIRVEADALKVDLLSIAGHKLYAPKGIGALYVRSGVRLEPLVHGAGQESGLRAGTENVLLSVGLGAACELASRRLPEANGIRALRDYFWSGLKARFGARVELNGHPERRLPNTLNVSFVGSVGSDVLARNEGVAASAGSACHAGSMKLSPVLEAMQTPPETGMGAIRFSLGFGTTRAELDAVLRMLEV
ncbi:MAG: cysteine desulfurase [Planctomycetota bacterium]|nr:cysteine desulfurase [Planctomycetota bacterium]